ncbi:MAG: hypothetical protein HY000_13850 [Planctomycetes bacterium]|nr:hypothetical protein [Planctomycetota bacterium]
MTASPNCRRPADSLTRRLALSLSRYLAWLLPLLWTLYDLCWIHPYHLSYYSPLSGRPAGARALGFESTFWGDCITPQVLDWLNSQPAGTTLVALWAPNLDALQTLGHLDRRIHLIVGPSLRMGLTVTALTQSRQGQAPADLRAPGLVLLTTRQSNFDPNELEPQVVKSLRPIRSWSTRDGVPLVVIYREDEIRELLQRRGAAARP